MKGRNVVAGILIVLSLCAVTVWFVFTSGIIGSQQPTTQLTVAAERGDASQVRKLIASGVDLNERDKSGYTALVWAARNGSTEVAKTLIEAHADMNARDCAANGWTPLIHAIHKNNNEMARLLIERGADVNAKAGKCTEKLVEEGASALLYAAGEDNTEIVRALLAKGADPYAEYDSENALSRAVAGALDFSRPDDKQCPTETVKVLLESAPDLSTKRTVWDRKSVFVARHKGCTEVVSLLEQRKHALAAKGGENN
ncbi:MAG TPA: ankyrin repeat domain-containing protein [Pyrinomonadaceae bacterium]|jgi:ankyrin repeat protein|nr:ankyrin repeat domain-containing protein [Pyrinomonadaceae bacterium]